MEKDDGQEGWLCGAGCLKCTWQGTWAFGHRPCHGNTQLDCLHLDASKNDPKPHPPPNQGHVASSTRVEGAEELQVSQAVKVLREKYISFLAEALPGLSHLAQSELLEDDALETAFFHGVEDGKSIPAALAVAAKCEIDRWAGPACGIGPTGLQCLFDQLGLDIGLATLAEVRRDKRLLSHAPWSMTATIGFPCG